MQCTSNYRKGLSALEYAEEQLQRIDTFQSSSRLGQDIADVGELF
jgi:hypothetical protein